MTRVMINMCRWWTWSGATAWQSEAPRWTDLVLASEPRLLMLVSVHCHACWFLLRKKIIIFTCGVTTLGQVMIVWKEWNQISNLDMWEDIFYWKL